MYLRHETLQPTAQTALLYCGTKAVSYHGRLLTICERMSISSRWHLATIHRLPPKPEAKGLMHYDCRCPHMAPFLLMYVSRTMQWCTLLPQMYGLLNGPGALPGRALDMRSADLDALPLCPPPCMLRQHLVMQDVNESIKAIIIPEGAHHLDLFFSHPKDPVSVRAARTQQRSEIHKWVQQKALHVVEKQAIHSSRAVTTS